MSLAAGVGAFADGARLLRSGGLGRYVWGPALASLAIVGLGLSYLFSSVDDLAQWMIASLPSWLDFLDVVLVPLLYLLSALVGTWLFGFLAIIISSPFHGMLSAAVENADNTEGDGLTEPAVPSTWYADIGRAVAREGRKLGYQLPRLVAVALVSFIPVINVLSPLIWLLYGAWMLAVQFCDLPGESRNHTFRDTLDLLRENRMAALGFGICVTPLLAIPLVNFLVVPVAVAGGTLLWRRLYSTPLHQAMP